MKRLAAAFAASLCLTAHAEEALPDFARHAPRNAGVYVAFDIQSEFSPQTLVGEIAKQPGGIQQLIQSGVPFSQISRWAKSRGFAAILPGQGQPSVLGKPFAVLPGLDELSSCQANLKSIATALEMYASDHAGAYPKSLAPLTPEYLVRVPQCPSAGSDTYSPGYQAQREAYTMFCNGAHHPAETAKYPQYTSARGAISSISPEKLRAENPAPNYVFAIEVSDEDAAARSLEGLPTEEIGGIRFSLLKETHLAVYEGHFLGASHREGAQALAAAVRGGDNLAADPQYQTLALKTKIQQQDLFVYVPLAPLTQMLPTLFKERSNPGIDEALAGFRYLGGGVRYRKGVYSSDTYLAVNPASKSPVVQKILSVPTIRVEGGVAPPPSSSPPLALVEGGAAPPPSSSPPLAFRSSEYLHNDWGNYQATNLPYLFDIGLEIARLFPFLRDQIPPLVPVYANNAWQVLSGEFATSTNLVTKLPEMLRAQERLRQARPQLLACEANLETLGNAIEAYKVQHKGAAPFQLANLVPTYLPRIPECPAAARDTYSAKYHQGAKPLGYVLLCNGHQHDSTSNPTYLGHGKVNYTGRTDQNLSIDYYPSFVIALGVQDPTVARTYFEAVRTAVFPEPIRSPIGGVQMYGPKSKALPTAVCLIERPTPAILFAIGPEGPGLLATMLIHPVPIPVEDRAAWVPLDPKQVLQGYLDSRNREPNESPLNSKEELARVLLRYLKASYSVVADESGLRGHLEGEGHLAAGALLLQVLKGVPHFLHSQGREDLDACTQNLKNTATALQIYSTDHNGHYPVALTDLTPNYLKVLPVCPASREVETYEQSAQPDAYTLYCKGSHHADVSVSRDHPRYNSNTGLEK